MTEKRERNAAFLHEMGIGPAWTRRDGAPPAADAAKASDAAGVPVAAHVPPVTAPDRPATETVSTAAWDEPEPGAVAPPARKPTLARTVEAADIGAMGWNELRASVESCDRCGLCSGRKRAVFGVGDQRARWLFVGEAPGYNEDIQGEPFVGPAGKLLDNMLTAMGLARGANVYIANVLKCRPTGDNGRDRPPTPEEIAACMPHLERQIALIEPTVIVALGKSAAVALLGLDPDTPVGGLRGTVHQRDGRPLVVTYHPAYLLRNPVDKRKTWADLRLAMATYASAQR